MPKYEECACSVNNCTSRGREFKYFCFPSSRTQLTRFIKWVEAAKNPRFAKLNYQQIYNRGYICERHFDEDDFIPDTNNRRLKRDAVPKYFLPTDGVRHPSCDKIDMDLDLSDLQLTEEAEIIQNLSLYDPDIDPAECRKINFNFVHYENVNSRSSCLESDSISNNENIPFEAENSTQLEINVSDAQLTEEAGVLVKLAENRNNEFHSGTKPYFKSLKAFISATQLVSVCRICLHLLTPSEEAVELNGTLEDSTEVINMLKLVLPDLDLALYPNVIICIECLDLIKYSYKLKETWLLAEEKLTKIVEDRKNSLKRDTDLIIANEKYKLQVFNPIMDHDYIIIDDEVSGEAVKKVTTDLVIPNSDSGALPNNNQKLSYNHSQYYYHKRQQLKEMWGKGPFICERCGRLFVTKETLKRHIRRHPLLPEEKIKQEKKKNCMCEICGKMFTNAHKLASHLTSHKNTKCNICNKEFIRYQQLQRHFKGVHKGEFYQCHLCGKRLVYRSSLRMHLKMHNPNKPFFNCSICNKKFYDVNKLKLHLNRHITKENYICKFCGRCLKYKENLEKHIRIYHTNEGKNVCQFCNKRYWKKCDLDKHKIRIHNSIREAASQENGDVVYDNVTAESSE